MAPAGTDIYKSRRLAEGYARSRPPVHARIIEVVRADLQFDARCGRALDVGCGAGLSAAALAPLAARVIGFDPEPNMLTHVRSVAPDALVFVGRAEHLPFPAGTFDLVTAAGAINYADLDRFLPEVARVLTPPGVFVVYDFSAGRRLRGDPRLDEWYSAFEERYPAAPGYHLDVRRLDYARHGLRFDGLHEMEIAVPMTRDSYLAYVLSESGVETAIQSGVPEEEIRDWCRKTLRGGLDDSPRDVLFDAYAAYVRPAPRA